MSTPTITDEQIAEIERFVGFGGSFIKVKSSALTGLISRLRAAERDAARYRWLREQEAEEGIAVLNVTGWERAATCWALTYPDAELLDSAIDAAMALPEPNHPA